MRNALHPLAFATHFVLLAATAQAADFTVGPPASGADFTDIQSAIDAASGSFDRVLVQPGVYVGSILINKDIDLIGSGPGVTVLQPTALAFFSAQPHIVVRDLGPNDRVRIAGFSLAGFEVGVLAVTEGYVEVLDCAGPVTLADLEANDPATTTPAGSLATAALRIENSSRVLIDRCTIHAGNGGALGADPSEGRAAVAAHSSQVWINDSNLIGATGFGESGSNASAGGPGLDAQDSSVTLAWSTVLGGTGSGASNPFVTNEAGSGASGVRATDGSVVRIDGGETTSIEGGRGGLLPKFSISAPGGPAIESVSGSQLIVSDDVQIVGGLNGFGIAQTPPVELDGGDLVSLAFTTIALRTTVTQPLPGESFELEVVGPPSTLIGIFSDNQSAVPLPLPFYMGVALIAPAVSESLIPVVTDPEGRATKTVTVPVLAAAGTRRYLQAAQLLGLSPGTISAPAFVTAGF